MGTLTFAALRAANIARLPLFKNAKGEPAHSEPDGSDWSLGDWSTAVTGEVGESANLIKKVRRGDFTLDEVRQKLADEFADIVGYLDILAFRCGIDLGAATAAKWDEVSARVGVSLRIADFAQPTDEQPLADEVLGVRRIEVTGGRLEMDLTASTEAMRILAGGAAKILESTGAENYVEMQMAHTDLPGETLTLTIQRWAGKTPHQCRQEAEARAATLERDAARMRAHGVTWLLIRDRCVVLERCEKKAAVLGVGEWFVPGGKIDGDESEIACCQREMREEWPGVEVLTMDPLPIVEGSAVPPGPRGLFLMRPFVVTVRGDVPSHSGDGVPLRWVPIAEALASPVPQVRMMVAAALSAAASDATHVDPWLQTR